MRINQGLFNLLCYYERTLCAFEDYVGDPERDVTRAGWEHRFGTVVGSAALQLTTDQVEAVWTYRTAEAPPGQLPDFPRMPEPTALVTPNVPLPGADVRSAPPIQPKTHLHARVQMNSQAWNSARIYAAWAKYEQACQTGDQGQAQLAENALRAELQNANHVRGDADEKS